MTYLEITTKNGLGRRTVELGDKPVRVGRSGDNDIVLRDTRVSRHHCIIEVINGKPLIRDLGSVRGIKVNNRKREESDLRAGDRVRIGPFTIALREEGAVAGAMENSPDRAANELAEQRQDWDDSANEGDDTSVPMGEGVDSHGATPSLLSEESQGDSQGTARGDSSTAPLVDQVTLHRLDELAEQVQHFQRNLSQRDDALADVLNELRELRAAHEAAVLTSRQRDELAEHVAQVEVKLSQRDDAMASVLSELRDLRSAQEAAAQANDRRTELAEAAQRISDLAEKQERLASEQSHVATAVQDLAARLGSIDESLRALPTLASRLQTLEETAQQSALIAQQALEEAAQLGSRVEQAHQLAHLAEHRITDVALEHAEAAAQVKAHEETLNHGTQQLMRLAQLFDEATQQQRQAAEQRVQMNSTVEALNQKLSQVRERFESIEKRLNDTPAPVASAPATQPDSPAVDAQLVALREAHQKDVATLRHSFEVVGSRLVARIERLEGASADAAPELSALKEQVRRLSVGHSRETATPRAVAAAARAATAKAGSTAVLDRPAPAPLPKRPAPGSNGVPPPVDSEQTRKVMSRIFHGNEVQNERYRPARDHSAIFVLVLVSILALGVGVVGLAMLLK